MLAVAWDGLERDPFWAILLMIVSVCSIFGSIFFVVRHAFALQWVEVDDDGFRAGTIPFPGRYYRWDEIVSVRMGLGGGKNMQPCLFPTGPDGTEYRGVVVQVESTPDKDWWGDLRATAARHGVEVTGDGPWTDLDVNLRTGEVTGRSKDAD